MIGVDQSRVRGSAMGKRHGAPASSRARGSCCQQVSSGRQTDRQWLRYAIAHKSPLGISSGRRDSQGANWIISSSFAQSVTSKEVRGSLDLC